MTFRKDCRCDCHTRRSVRHIGPCCRRDLEINTKPYEPETTDIKEK